MIYYYFVAVCGCTKGLYIVRTSVLYYCGIGCAGFGWFFRSKRYCLFQICLYYMYITKYGAVTGIFVFCMAWSWVEIWITLRLYGSIFHWILAGVWTIKLCRHCCVSGLYQVCQSGSCEVCIYLFSPNIIRSLLNVYVYCSDINILR